MTPLDRSEWEVYKKFKNRMYDRAKELLADKNATETEIIVNATLLLNQEAFRKGQITLYKWRSDLVVQVEALADAVVGDNAEDTTRDLLSAIMYRQNHLDRVICGVRDCFGVMKAVGGYPVFAVNGSKATDVCFDRRNRKDRIRAYIDPEKIVRAIRERERLLETNKKKLPGLPLVTYEDLTAFEYTDDESVWEASLKAWSTLVGAYIVDCNNNGTASSVDADTAGVIKDVLSPMRNSRKINYHEDVIQNYDEIFEVMRTAGKGGYIRSSGSSS